MITFADSMPVVGTIGGGFLVGALIGYALKKTIKIVAVIVGLFIAALAYLEYQRIISVDWDKIQSASQNGITMLANSVTHISNNIGATHTGALPNFGIPLVSSASAGFILGMVRG
jgi:uncharacterized membrane protein (Fun14 family)